MSRLISIGGGFSAPIVTSRSPPGGPRMSSVRGVSPEQDSSTAAAEAARWLARQARAPPDEDNPALVFSFGATSAKGEANSSARDPPAPGRNLVVDGGRYGWAWRPPPANSDPEVQARTRKLVEDLDIEKESAELEKQLKRKEDFAERLSIKLEREKESAEGSVQGWREGYANGMRRCLVSLLAARGQSLSPDVAAQIESASPTDLADWFHRALGGDVPNTVFGAREERKAG